MPSRQLIIDSRARVDPSSSPNDFILHLQPSALEPASVASLAFASIPTPSGVDFAEPFWLLSLSGFGLETRMTEASGSTMSSFSIPVLAANGYRTIYNEGNNYSQQARGPSTSLSEIHVRLHLPSGETAPVGTAASADWFAVIRLE
jgi:hypothetical protein